MDSQSLHSKASQDTLVSLVQLDPTPMESPNVDKDLPPLPEHPEGEDPGSPPSETSKSRTNTSSTAATTASVGLSGGGSTHGAIYYLTRIQRYSSYTFSLFATLHLATTSIIPLVARSVPASESYLLLAREIYQTPLSEPLLVALPLVAHVGSGVAVRLLRRVQNLRRYGYHGDGGKGAGLAHHRGDKTSSSSSPSLFTILRSGWPPLSYISLSGYGFAAILAAHVGMNRGLPLAVEGDSANVGLAFVAHGFARHPAVSWLAYAALLGLGCGHMVWGYAKWFGAAQGAGWKLDRHTGNAAADKQRKDRRRRRLLLVNAVATVATAVWAAGGLGVVARGGLTLGWVGKLYDDLFRTIPGF
ncbi:hypothetical protein B0T26DRAFT_709623 [Lasiosphaeria miniovina]|uniref:Mitochondrial adapter protein MCP1 transmembrane domain-containing protein n=1 Tax=Lasiosphaeria miniovina TaxID=1954250 RepID=A0AA40AK42_9PEZI|nr:uncharacterized protein B0T26DRAFT_709623 [Lasiosphaeria miniovina]KAK0717339.1 hypothetical protein B0T26DRAFT_709623 [Lasiosphaeria miniovina]